MSTKFWSEKSDGKRPLARPRCRWEANIGMDNEVNGMDWIYVRFYEHGNELSSYIKCG
jgi:hypothetical protein